MPTPKRVVSKPEYVVYFTRVTALLISGGMSFLLGAFFSLCTIVLVCAAIYCFFFYNEPSVLGDDYSGLLGFYASISAGISGFSALALFKLGIAASNKCSDIELVEPMTRQNIENLPAEDTLVRASQEPITGQEKILLRAAHPTEETKPEELLRASPTPFPSPTIARSSLGGGETE